MFESKEQKSFLLLKSMAVNFPILSECGLVPNKLLILVVPEGSTKKVIDFLSDEDTPILCEKMPWKQVISVLENTNSTGVAYPYTHSRKGMDFLASLATGIKVGEISGKKINALLFVISEGIPRGCAMEEFFALYMEQDINFPDAELVIPPDDQIAVVMDKIVDYTNDICQQEEKAFLAAACFLYPNLARKGLQNQFHQFLKCAKQLVEEDDNNRGIDDICGLFLENLYDWQEKTKFCEIYELPYLYINMKKVSEQVMFFDSRFVYMKECFFKRIFGKLLEIFSVDKVKKSLREEHILSSDCSKTYTIKMGYYDMDGIYRREQMLRFYRERLSILGEMEFVDLCLETHGGDENAD